MNQNKKIKVGKLYQFKIKTSPVCISLWRRPYRQISSVTNIIRFKYMNPQEIFMILEYHEIKPRTDFAVKILTATGIVGWICIDPEEIIELS